MSDHIDAQRGERIHLAIVEWGASLGATSYWPALIDDLVERIERKLDGTELEPLNAANVEGAVAQALEELEGRRQREAAERETERLASYLLDHYADEPGRTGVSESAVDVAIRLLDELRDLKAALEEIRRRWLDQVGPRSGAGAAP